MKNKGEQNRITFKYGKKILIQTKINVKNVLFQ